MHPELLRITDGPTIYSYGVCLMLGFGLATWWAARRAKRAGAAPREILNIALLAVVFGVGGARLLYVVHYWKNFATRSNPLRAVLDVRQGGLEFLGGFVCAVIVVFAYLMIPRRQAGQPEVRRGLPIRLYLDILAPSVMMGLAFARIGCFLNGCCFGGVCVSPETGNAEYAWAVRFPFGSPVFVRQWEQRLVTIPAELVRTSSRGLTPQPVSRTVFSQVNKERAARVLAGQLRYPARADPTRATSVAELRSLAAAAMTKPTHPVQLYASLSAILLAVVLAYVYRVRRRHGVVFVALLLLYAPVRFVLESIRTDNPVDTVGLTISQFTSVTLFLVGLALLFIFYRYLPERSPGANVETSKRRNVGTSKQLKHRDLRA